MHGVAGLFPNDEGGRMKDEEIHLLSFRFLRFTISTNPERQRRVN